MEGGSASDSLDPRTYADSIPISYGWQIWNGLVEIDANGDRSRRTRRELRSQARRDDWIFNIRKGVTFTSGKTLDADDVIYSLNLHRGETKSGAKDLLSRHRRHQEADAQPDRDHAEERRRRLALCVRRLSRPDRARTTSPTSPSPTAPAPSRSRASSRACACSPSEEGQLLEAGPRQFRQHRVALYSRTRRARTQALISGQIDAANRLDAKTVSLVMKAPTVNVVRTKGTGNRFAFVALCDTDPYTNNDIRLALKYGIDRQKIVDNVYKGFATIGNDTTVAAVEEIFRQGHPAAPLRSRQGGVPFQEGRHGQRQHGVAGLRRRVLRRDRRAVLYQEAMKKAGIDLQVKRVSGDGYWDNVWLKAPFCAVYWGGRPTADNQLSQTFLSSANWNDTHWQRPEFDKLLFAARAELDEAKRTQMYADAQKMIVDDGGMVCFAIGDYLDGYARR